MRYIFTIVFGLVLVGCGAPEAPVESADSIRAEEGETEPAGKQVLPQTSVEVRRVGFAQNGAGYGAGTIYGFCDLLVESVTLLTQNVVVKMNYYQVGFDYVPISDHRPGLNCGAIVEVGGFIEFKLTADCRSVVLRQYYNNSDGNGPGVVGPSVCSGSIFVAESEGKVQASLSIFTNNQGNENNVAVQINGGESF